MSCRRFVATTSDARKTGVVACIECDPSGLFAMGHWNESADIEARLRLLRAAERPGELHTGPGSNGNFKEPTAQGNILSAITKLERRRAELLGKAR